MAESQKGNSSSVDPKEKKSSLDDDVGKEFLSSWKSLSVTGDDTMDFSFDTVPSGKRKTFNFDKLDMDFNLDGDFDKLTSFKLDMPDLDFSSPSKKTAKPKESSKGESSRVKHQGKQDCFTFSFDFNELDNFNFDSTLIQGEKKTSMKNPDCKEAGSASSEHQGSKVNLAGNDDAFDDSQTNKLHASEKATSSISETSLSGVEKGNSSNESFPSKYGNIGDLVVPQSTRTSQQKIISASVEGADQQSCLLQKAMPTEACAQRTTKTLPVQSVHINHKEKQECSTLYVDFNESDHFNFDLTKTSMKNPESERVGSDRSESHSAKVNLAGGDDAFVDNQTNILPASDNAISSIIDSTFNVVGAGNSSNGNFPSQDGTIGNLVVQHSTRTSPEKIICASTKEADQQSCFLEKAMPTEAYAQLTTQVLPVQSADGNDSTRDTESDIQTRPLDTKVNLESVAGDNVSDRMITVVGINHGKSQLNLAPPYFNGVESTQSKSEKTDGETQTRNLIGTEPIPDDRDLEATSTSSILQTRPHGFSASEDIQKSASKFLAQTRSDHVVNIVTPAKEKELGVVRSKFFKRSKEGETQLGQPPSTTVEGCLLGSKGIAVNHPANGKREGFNAITALNQRKLIGDSKSFSMEMTKEPALQGSEKNDKTPCNIREGLNGVSKQNVCKLNSSPRLPDKGVTKDAIVPGTGNNIKDLNNFGCEVNPASSKSTTQTSIKSTAVFSSMGSTWNSKMISVEGLKAEKRTPDLSGLKISRTLGVSKDQSNAVLKREISSFRNSEKNMEVQGFTALKIVHPIVNAERKTLLNASLKRKTFEASNADLLPSNPQKRLSQSPSESRNLKEALEITVEEQGCNHDNFAENKIKSILYNSPTSKFEIPQQENTKEQDIPLAMENDRNVRKAEAYAKELEDIGNMLKKKYEEAKELLVRAIVNNNSLLMLNHPMFDEKIRMVQKLAAELMSN